MPKKSTKKAASRAEPSTDNKRVLKRPSYKHFRVSKRIKHPAKPIKSAPRIFVYTLQHLRKSWKLYGALVIIYLLLTLLFVKGFTATSNLSSLKQNLHSILGGGSLSTGVTLFGVLLGSASSGNGDSGATYQSILIVLMSLVFIWTIRQRFADHKVKISDSFYKSMYPLVPLLLVLFVIMLQLIPLIIGNALYGTVIGNGIAVSGLEKFLWSLLFFLLAILSLYMITSSLFALFIVTLPDVRPMQALRSARELVRYRRWTILRKLLFLPLAILIIGLVIMFPILLWATAFAEWIFLLLSILCMPLALCYLYSLYRELL